MKLVKMSVFGAFLMFSCQSFALDLSGYDKFGYDKHGYNPEGYNFFGYNKQGFNKQGCHAVHKQKNKEGADCSVDLFYEKTKNDKEFLEYQLRRSKELLYWKE